MDRTWNRRDVLSLMGVGGLVFGAGLWGCAPRAAAAPEAKAREPERRAGRGSEGNTPHPAGPDFVFLQLSDTHWGYHGDANPEADTTLRRAIATINRAPKKPDFVVFTGDLTQTTDDAAVRRARMKEFLAIVGELDVPTRYFLPGEHDASLDGGEAYREHFGASHYAFDHGGVHFVALDNVSDPTGAIGETQLDWLSREVAGTPSDAPLVVLAHRPLFDLFPAWDWATRDGGKALALLDSRENVTVFYGHVHQEHHHVTGRVRHHAARSLVFPLPAPGSVPKKAPEAWAPEAPFRGLGYRAIDGTRRGEPTLTELPVEGAPT